MILVNSLILIKLVPLIKYQNQCHYAYFRAYQGRMEHRTYGLVPEYYDYGHNKQFDIIMNKINECEEQLRSLYDQYLQDKDHIKTVVQEVKLADEVEGEDLQVVTIINKVDTFKRQRIDDAEKERMEIQQYISAAKKVALVNKLIVILKSSMEN